MRKWILVCPASRGIGFAMTRLLLRRTDLPIVATARTDDLDGLRKRLLSRRDAEDDSLDDEEEVRDDGRLHLLRVDVTDESSIEAAAKYCDKHFPRRVKPALPVAPNGSHLHLAFITPGILPHPPEIAPHQIDIDRTKEIFAVNTFGPMLLFKHFFPFLPKKGTSTRGSAMSNQAPKAVPSAGTQHGEAMDRSVASDDESLRDRVNRSETAIWAMMSARLGSTSDNRTGGWYAYRASKAALNSLARSFDHHVSAHGGDQCMAISLHPGTVLTDLTAWYVTSAKRVASSRSTKPLMPQTAVEKLFVVLRNAQTDMRGRCWDWKADEILP